jgi:hypothetical protein
MSSPVPPRADVALARPKTIARIERYGKFDERPLCAKSEPSNGDRVGNRMVR